MGKSRTTRSTTARGSSLPPPGSFTDLRSFFPPTDMPHSGTDKMAPDTSAARSRTSARLSPPPHPPHLTSTDYAPDPMGASVMSSLSGAVSPPYASASYEAAPHGLQSAMRCPPLQQYTQCFNAFPRLLRTAPDPCSHGTDPGSPTPSDLSVDFRALPGPMYPASQMLQDPVMSPAALCHAELKSPPSKAQRLALPQAPGSPRERAVTPATYAQKVCPPIPTFTPSGSQDIRGPPACSGTNLGKTMGLTTKTNTSGSGPRYP